MGKNNDSVQRISSGVIKAGSNIAASSVSGDSRQVVATAIAEAVGLAVEVFFTLSTKRSNELFDDQEVLAKTVEEIQKSSDFASAVFDIWSRYNLESHEQRRLMLKKFLEGSLEQQDRHYENFTKLLNVIQEIDFDELSVLSAFYSPQAYKFSKVGAPAPIEYLLNTNDVCELMKINPEKNQLKAELIAEDLNQLGHMGLVHVRYNSLNGPYYTPNTFGRLLISYLN